MAGCKCGNTDPAEFYNYDLAKCKNCKRKNSNTNYAKRKEKLKKLEEQKELEKEEEIKKLKEERELINQRSTSPSIENKMDNMIEILKEKVSTNSSSITRDEFDEIKNRLIIIENTFAKLLVK